MLARFLFTSTTSLLLFLMFSSTSAVVLLAVLPNLASACVGHEAYQQHIRRQVASDALPLASLVPTMTLPVVAITTHLAGSQPNLSGSPLLPACEFTMKRGGGKGREGGRVGSSRSSSLPLSLLSHELITLTLLLFGGQTPTSQEFTLSRTLSLPRTRPRSR